MEDQTNASKVPACSISEPDLSRRTDENASKPPPNGFLRRAGSSVFQRATSFVSRGKQANLEEGNMRFDGACIESTAAMNTNLGPQEHRELPEARKNSPALYVQCSEYYSRCVNSFGRDGISHLAATASNHEIVRPQAASPKSGSMIGKMNLKANCFKRLVLNQP
ncbi:uncharacterized protein LOC112342624 [Selaginella moellendorffii]|uniref:uncharacterized protein LOC112342624 n=1 Tax=Selaginella moellendorffii TaxID=88036 RepID=UPI000D1D105A|nr:uncharacterized protein LOC112342624 [Selaginella moellendorffii]|eukprot:XP_024520478.1 uncharacterized protein LOC112342624 [Selaginella moellendorffii]